MGQHKFVFAVLMFAMFITMAGVGIMVPVMPTYLEIFGVGGTVLGFLIASFALAQFLFSPIAGDLSDRHGRKIFIVVGLVVYGVAQYIFGYATEIWMLFASRFLSGFGAAFIAAPVMAYVADITLPQERGKGMGLIGASMSLGFMIGPGFGGFLSNVNIHFPFLLSGSLALATAAIALFALPNIKPQVNPQAVRENLWQQLTRSTQTPYFVLLIVVFTFSFGIANFQGTLALLLADKFSYTANDIAIILTIGGFIGVILQTFVIGKLFKRFGEMNVILVNLLVAAAMMLLTIFVSGFFLITVVATLFSIATTFIRPAVNTLISKMAGMQQGYASGMNNAFMSLGTMFGPALAGILYDWNMNSPYIFGAIILVLCFFLAYAWQKKQPKDNSMNAS
ncbi:MFS transporter [Caryophanon latum]|uniref:Multidrug transporter n=1 Tax=Caryophanon latum TaxID=33977 RepID=A0A1C0Z2J6_9BACL|nr:MFS transporter [Caryophanon latum]OCS93687.1 multidrug transporter [Caryophanon latum]